MTRPSGERMTAEFSHSISRSSSAASGLDACDSISHSSRLLGGPFVVAVPGRVAKGVERQLQRFRAENALVLLVDRLQLRRLLESGEREIALARDRFHERLAFSSQALKGELAHVVSFAAR